MTLKSIMTSDVLYPCSSWAFS